MKLIQYMGIATIISASALGGCSKPKTRCLDLNIMPGVGDVVENQVKFIANKAKRIVDYQIKTGAIEQYTIHDLNKAGISQKNELEGASIGLNW